MKFTIQKSKFITLLKSVSGAITGSSTLPILSSVAISAANNIIELSASDLELSLRANCESDVADSGAVALPAKRLAQIINAMREGDIEVVADSKFFATITQGTSRFKLLGLSTDEFPPTPDISDDAVFSISQDKMKAALLKVLPAISTDDSRYILNGVLLDVDQGLVSFVATDGRRMARANEGVGASGVHQIVVPAKTVKQLVSNLSGAGIVTIAANESLIQTEVNGVLITSKRIDGTFPNYKQIIPANSGHCATIERESFLRLVALVSICASEKSNSVKLTLSGNLLRGESSTADVGESSESMPIKWDGPDIKIAFNPIYISDAVKVLAGEDFALHLIDGMSPGVVREGDGFMSILMPMRVA